MQRIMGYMRKAIQEYKMIENGDRIAVGISGGKDSLALAAGLAGLRRFIGIDFTLVGITLDPGWNGQYTDYTPLQQLCEKWEMEYHVIRTEIGPIVFEAREESNPCSLCARMRRGALHDAAKAHGCNKIALGHHYDDAVETFVMNLFQEGRIGCFSPVTYLSRKDITMIRPLVFAPEHEIASAVRKAELPIVKSQCPVDGATTREWTKNWLREMEKEHRGITHRIFGAMKRGNISGW
ncbi:MAG: tRNA 2-thiocytidine biosynthesis protein TtcA [Oscillospiraceae bacterium]|nr:tRNA 2-thiocytidine biosynthesis protein TtcA [Oscillospiraceae bacterium]MBQ2792094.1 tRNA 2-thiocytidine biosynthesis protein TtcA [Oscillospiraceae bacterium]MBQ3241809.1 tRNA 2-thiocytidine biosynthesis protein TtcA [Oscillospiraceae bacterium]